MAGPDPASVLPEHHVENPMQRVLNAPVATDEARDLGADKEKARAELVMLDKKTPESIYALMLRNLDSLWTTTADWESVTLVLLQDCINRRGAYESGT